MGPRPAGRGAEHNVYLRAGTACGAGWLGQILCAAQLLLQPFSTACGTHSSQVRIYIVQSAFPRPARAATGSGILEEGEGEGQGEDPLS